MAFNNDYTKMERQDTRHVAAIPRDELHSDHPPRGITIERTFDGGTVVKIRMFSWESFMSAIGITLFWNGLVSVFVWLAIKTSAILLWLFLTPFIAIGLALVFGLLFTVFGKSEIKITNAEGSVFTGIGPFGKTRRFAPKSVKRFGTREKQVTHWEGSSPVVHIPTIVMNNGREIKLPRLDSIRETWLVFALAQILKLPAPTN